MKLSLDILIPALPERLRQDDLQKAMRYTKKIVIEEGHSLPQLIHCWNIIIRHADVFYPYRSYFIPLMIQSITRLGLTSSCPLDQRQVAVGIADVIVEWEWFRQQRQLLKRTPPEDSGAVMSEAKSPEQDDAAPAGQPARPSGGAAAAGTGADRELDVTLHATLVPVLANFLVRLGLFAAEGKDAAMYKLSARCLAIFRKMTHLVPMKNVRMAYFDRYFQTTVENLKPKGSSSAGQSASNSKSTSAGSSGNSSSNNNSGAGGAQSNPPVSDRSLDTFLLFLTSGLRCSDGPSPLFINSVASLKELIPTMLGTSLYPKAQNSFREAIILVRFK